MIPGGISRGVAKAALKMTREACAEYILEVTKRSNIVFKDKNNNTIKVGLTRDPDWESSTSIKLEEIAGFASMINDNCYEIYVRKLKIADKILDGIPP